MPWYVPERMSKCPICAHAAKPRAENTSFPFCTPRCKTIDFGKWINEDYRVPVEGAVDSDSDDERSEPD